MRYAQRDLGCHAINAAFAGEVYVLNDGGEVDLDLGNYERYLDVTLSRDNNITTGKIYSQVIEKEVRGTPVSPCAARITFATTETWRLPGKDRPGILILR